MDLTSYTGLKEAIASFINRTDLTAAIPAFIVLAEAQMNRRLRCRRMVGRSDITLDAGEEFYALPADFIGPIDFILKTAPLARLAFFETANFLAENEADRDDANAVPSRYTIVGDELQLGPLPLSPFEAELTYWRRPSRLSDANASNWVLASHPDVYLYGALVQSAPYLADDARTPVWAALFSQAIADANAADPLPTGNAPLRLGDWPRGLSSSIHLATGN